MGISRFNNMIDEGRFFPNKQKNPVPDENKINIDWNKMDDQQKITPREN